MRQLLVIQKPVAGYVNYWVFVTSSRVKILAIASNQ